MDKKRAAYTLVILSLVVIGIVVWVALRPPPSPQAIKYGYLPIASDASFFVAVERNYFSDAGVQVEPVKFETSNQALEALVAGRVDATAVVALEAALALEANTPDQFRVVEMTAATAATKVHRIMVKKNSSIQSLADLKDKKVGTFPGSQMVVFLKLILSRHFDADRNVEIIQLKAPLQPQALESGQVDALFCLEPTCTMLEEKGLARFISVNPLYEFIQQPFPTAVGVVSTRLTKDNPGLVVRIQSALGKAHQYIKEHPQDSSGYLPKYTPVEAGLAPKISVYDYWGVQEVDRGAVQRLADLYVSKGVLTKSVSTARLYVAPAK